MNPIQIKLIGLLKKPTVCMLAPSFPIDFKYPNIIGMLKELGFDKVTELTYGARIVNYWYVDYVKSHPKQKYYITSPCPTCVSLIQKRYPEIEKYLVPHVSPMAAMAKIAKKYFPDHNVVFVSPCYAKQMMEAPKYDDVIDLVITFKELGKIFEAQDIQAEDFEEQSFEFDSFYEEDTKVYPISGGLAQTAHLRKYFKDDELFIADQPVNLLPAFEEIKAGKSKYRFFDILNCPGGCIGGPGLANSKLPTEAKRKKVLDYQKSVANQKVNSHDVELESSLDFKAKL